MKNYVNNSNFIELVSELANQVTVAEFGETESLIEENDEIRYTEEAQDFFNDKYDEVETLLNNTIGVYSENELEL